ncbi:seryl-tRNA synthetase [Bartonella elizabethae Re6043vi]|uniref:Serine--tRNA ligase n=2 Tax=Bartonella elizabethae TaxID=807 RepID=J1A3J0_BAREL|nr:serine--tRNA ligase [Bartonella elizabethae]EJF83893.1 seryl-tRNA synthetase [Bartonella elizabethae Re6043vi]EJF96228.1 seryl-tRNA synthetase [Bartonella elizabethae F9251 = ATCC 49927]VEJ40865.1 Serine--tRNA ligase [Bartonella elizabethae]
MLDIKWIRENPEELDKALVRRGLEPQAERLIQLDLARRSHVAKVQLAQERRNAISKEIGQALATSDQQMAERLRAEVEELKVFLSSATTEEKELTESLEKILSALPNIPLDDVPEGKDESDNVVIRHFGTPPTFNFTPKEHFDLGQDLKQMNFERASRLSGTRFTVLSGALARLERALGQFMLDVHVNEHGYTEVSVPLLVRDEIVYGAAQLPKFAEDLFQTTDGRWLISTAEVPLTNLVNDEILEISDLPLRFSSLSPCFRSEAGAAGRDTRGMLRQHQFWKVEMVSITSEEQSLIELERMTECAEDILKRLGLPFRTVVLSTGDMGFAARKTYDIEVWLPGQECYREISSCSVCGDFQGRRMNARYRKEGDKKLHFVHSLNGSGTAVGRCLIAVLENYQQADGSIIVPDVLQPYMGGMRCIIA